MGIKHRYGSPLALMILAGGGGVVGGFIYSALLATVSAQSEQLRIIRAVGVELVDNAGRRVGFLGTDERRNTGLAFFDQYGKKRAEFRLGGGEHPLLAINGSDGHERLSLGLGHVEKPYLMMSDNDFNGRVYLGVAEPDAPDPNWKYDAWVLRFKGDNNKTLATIGMRTRSAGGVLLLDQSGRVWQTPLKLQ